MTSFETQQLFRFQVSVNATPSQLLRNMISVYLIAVFVISFIGGSLAGSWSPYITSNMNGDNTGKYIPLPQSSGDSWTFYAEEQSGYGIVDFGVRADNANFFSTYNTNGNLRSITINKPIEQIEVREQSGYGIVNIRFRYTDNSYSNWITTNSNGSIKPIATNGKYRGLMGRVQSAYGIINLRAHI
eukprot:199343_1